MKFSAVKSLSRTVRSSVVLRVFIYSCLCEVIDFLVNYMVTQIIWEMIKAKVTVIKGSNLKA